MIVRKIDINNPVAILASRMNKATLEQQNSRKNNDGNDRLRGVTTCRAHVVIIIIATVRRPGIRRTVLTRLQGKRRQNTAVIVTGIFSLSGSIGCS